MKETFSQRLRRLREAKDLSASELARKINVPQSTYSDWENGKGLRLPPFQDLSRALTISVTELVLGQSNGASDVLVELEIIEAKIREIRTNLGSVN